MGLGEGKLISIVAENVRSFREKRKLTQQRLAEQCGVDVRTINRIEAADHNPTVDVLERLSLALGIPPALLVSSDRESPPAVREEFASLAETMASLSARMAKLKQVMEIQPAPK